MAWIYLAASEESPWPFLLGSGPSPIVKTTDTLRPCFFQKWPEVNCPEVRSGMTCKRSEEQCSLQSTSSTADFLARTSALPELESAWVASDPGFSSKSSDSLANFDRDSFSWRTSQLSLFGGLTEFSWSSLRWGMIVGGRLFQPQKWEPRTCAKDGSFWPTPVANDDNKSPEAHLAMKARMPGGPRTKITSLQVMVKAIDRWPTPKASDSNPCGAEAMLRYNERTGRKTLITEAVKRPKHWPTPRASDGAKGGPNQRGSKGDLPLPAAVMKFPTPCARDYRTGDQADSVRAQTRDHSPNLNDVVAPGGQLNPTWVEWLMGYPLEWTVLEDWATRWFRSKHGRRSPGYAALKPRTDLGR